MATYRYGSSLSAYRPRPTARPRALSSLFYYRPPDGDPANQGPAPGPGMPGWNPTAQIDPHDTSFGQAPGDAGLTGTNIPNPGGGHLLKSDLGGPVNPEQPKGPGPGGGGGGGGYSFEGDPILAQIRAMNAKLLDQARAAQLAGTKQEQIAYGYDPNLKYADAATQEAARQNPYSALGLLLRGHEQRGLNLDESLNKSNLFYSGERGRQIGLEGFQYTGERVGANQGYQGKINALAQMLQDVETQAQEREIQGMQSAYERALQYGYGGGGGGGGGGSGGGGLENARQFGNINGLSDEQLNAAASQYASGRSYGGSPYQPGMVMQEGHVEVRNGVPGVYIKYRTAGGDSTEWTPIG